MADLAHAADDHGHGHPTGWRPLRLFDEPQGHRLDVPDLRDLRGMCRRLPVDDDARRADGAGLQIFKDPHTFNVFVTAMA